MFRDDYIAHMFACQEKAEHPFDKVEYLSYNKINKIWRFLHGLR